MPNGLSMTKILLAAALLLAGCDQQSPAPPPPASTASATIVSPPPAAATRPVRVVFLGDSITAGLGLSADQAYPALIAQAFESQNASVHIVNAGVSGDTTAGGLRRIDWLLRQSPDLLVIALGANDGLRAQDITHAKANLIAIIRKAQDARCKVLLIGMKMPPNLGQQYTEGFEAIYPQIASETNVPLLPFLLQDVAGDPRLNQPDGIHPTAAGQQIIASHVLAFIKPHVDTLLAARDNSPQDP